MSHFCLVQAICCPRPVIESKNDSMTGHPPGVDWEPRLPTLSPEKRRKDGARSIERGLVSGWFWVFAVELCHLNLACKTNLRQQPDAPEVGVCLLYTSPSPRD